MTPSAKSIREDLARAKVAYGKNDDLRTLQLLVGALRAFLRIRLAGPDRIMVEGLLRECFANVSKLERVKKRLPHGIPYVKGQEKKLFAALVPLARTIEEELKHEDLEAKRERKLRIDHAIIKGTKLLGEGNLLEAQRNFRAAVEDYVDEKGLFPLIASRLIDAGHFKASLEYVKRAIEESPDNPRAYDFLQIAAGKANEWELARRILADARQKVGPAPLLCQSQAMVEARLGHWNDALSAAKHALESDPHLEDARKVHSVAQKKLVPPTTSA